MIRLLLLGLLTAGTLASASQGARPSGPAGAQTGLNSISSFSPVDVSPTELRIGVVYNYNGVRGTEDVYITASALQRDGSSVPGLVNDLGRAAVRIGTGKALTVLKRESPGRPIRSAQVEVCINHRYTGDIVCRSFPHLRVWGEAGTPPSPPGPSTPETPERPTPPSSGDPSPQPPAPSGTCRVMGKISGELTWSREGERGGRTVVHKGVLKEMVMTSRDGTRLTAPINGGHYAFTNVPAGKMYILAPLGRFRAEPRSRTIDCRRNMTFQREDFKITGGGG